MAYRKPGVTVTQEFAGVSPALAIFNLPSVSVGAAYQLVNDDLVGTYSGSLQAYSYASLLGGAAVDLEELASDELFPVTKKPVSVKLVDAEVEIVSAQTDGAVVVDTLTDATPSQFDDVLAGDIVVVVPALALTILAAQTNGQSVATSGLRDRLTAGTAGQFANVKVGDTVVVTAGTNASTGTFTVAVKISNSVLKLDSDVNDGVGASTDTAYSITGDRGVANAGEYRIASKTDANTLVLESPMPESEQPLSYSVKRVLPSVVLARVANVSLNGFVASATSITIPGSGVLEVEINSIMFPVIGATSVLASYRALRTDLAAEVFEITKVADITIKFGEDQIHPANPLAQALTFMLQNTVTAVNGLGLDGDAVTDEVTSFLVAADVLKLTDMYAIALLTQNPVIHTTYKNHVEQLSLPEAKQERVVLFNSKLALISVLQDAAGLSTATLGARSIVPVQVDGNGAFASPATLNDGTTDQFLNVAIGDSVIVQSGTGVTPGTYSVLTKPTNNQLVLSASFITSGTPTDIQYYIVRKDGLGADGVTFYDRNATFISNGVAAGHFIKILDGAFPGRYKIATVNSELQVTLAAAVPGVATLQTGMNYQADRDLSKTEQANNVKGYSQSFASRRCVHVWPDVLKAPIGQDIEDLPGYFAPPTLAALTTGLPTQQGFTNLAISGFLGFNHSTRYFNEAQLNTIADGGTMILAQDGPNQPLFVRHQLTTDRSAVKFQEFSITKNVDFIAKFLRDGYTSYIGQFNIVDTTMDELQRNAQKLTNFLRDKTKLPKIGGVIRSGSLASMKESDTAIDAVELRFSYNIPVPLNNIDITLQV